MTTAIKSVSVSLELLEMLKKYRISPSEAFRVGVSVILSELGEFQYLNSTNLGRRVQRMGQMIDELQTKVNEYEDKNVLAKKE